MTMAQVRHDALLEVTVKSGRKVLNRKTVYAKYMGAHVTLQSFIYNANPYSGGGLWHNPVTGEAMSRPTVTYKVLNPEEAVLNPGELCDCADCTGGFLAPLEEV